MSRDPHATMATLERSILLAPDRVARAAARTRGDPRQRWMLLQARAVRRSYVEHALDRGPLAEEIWMLRQPDPVRESYVREVLNG